MDFEITDMEPAFSKQVAQLWHKGWIDGHIEVVPKELTALRTLASFQQRSIENISITRLALQGDDVLGFTMIKANELYQIYVSTASRGKGVAQLLMKDCERIITDSGHQTAWLSCAIGNDRAARFYEKQGWINVGEETVLLDTSSAPFPLRLWRFEKRL